jgi:cellulose synthase/poly-beta-1,6-N-acetylglucosamine synthase-like glycosyltransferase
MIVIEVILLTYFFYVVLYTLIFSFAGLLRPSYAPKGKRGKARIAVLIPAYQEDAVIALTAKKALKQHYPDNLYEVIVIADSLQMKTLDHLTMLPVRVFEVSFENSTKVKALNYALNHLEDDFDIAVILDADNEMAPAFLDRMNQIFQTGVKAIQGRRVAKNRDTDLAVLDGISEIFNNHIYRAGSTALGLSTSLSGSGMAFDFHLLKETLREMDSVGGFDRELEIRLLLQGIKTKYYRNAVVFDEKTSEKKNFANQRRRWIASQYFYLKKYFQTGLRGLLRGNMSLFNSAILRNLQMPRVINLGLLGLLTLASSWLEPWLQIDVRIWWVLSVLIGISLIIAVPMKIYNLRFLKALFALPGAFLVMFSLMFKLKGANEEFIHTAHRQEKVVK